MIQFEHPTPPEFRHYVMGWEMELFARWYDQRLGGVTKQDWPMFKFWAQQPPIATLDVIDFN